MLKPPHIHSFHKTNIIALLSLLLTCCGDPKPEDGEGGTDTGAGEMQGGIGPLAGEIPAGEIPAGEIPAGEIPAGEMPAGEIPAGEIPAGEMPAGEMPAGEMPAGEMPAGEMPAGEMPAGEMPAGEMPAGEMPAGEMPNPCESSEDCADMLLCVQGMCVDVPVNEVDFCRVQYPLSLTIEAGDTETFYARVYEEGLTDISVQTDASPLLHAELGIRPSSPADDESDFMWFSAIANEEYQGDLEGGDELNNDEYMYEFTFQETGLFQVAARFSVDGGQSWILCDGGQNGEGSSDGFQALNTAEVNVVEPCDEGYVLEGSVCVDLDECAIENGGCSAQAECENQEGLAPICSCLSGYRGDGITCTDIDECAEGNGGCDLNADCTNNLGADPTCECKTGYQGDGQTCTDIDECAEGNGGCDQNANCTNQIGAAPLCQCRSGYQGNGQTCEDIDECAEGNGGCDPNAGCTNQEGATPLCQCRPGFQGDGQNCEDVDECAENNGDCDANADCANQIGAAPTCTCRYGYQGDGSTCVDVNECDFSNGNCDINANCTNNIGADPTCECRPGFEGNGRFCSDIDECAEGNGGCNINADCTNNIGADPTCECRSGYQGDGLSCEDIDECAEGNGGCDLNADCTNNVGADPNCACKSGYQGNGQNCEDVDECAQDNGGCDVNADCTNNIGAPPTCICRAGYDGDGESCTLLPPLTAQELTEGDLVITELMPNPEAVGDAQGEWIEIYNTTRRRVSIDGLSIEDIGNSIIFTTPSYLADDLIIPPLSYFVFAREIDVNLNGGVVAQLDYDGLTLNNTNETISLVVNGLIIDTISYATSPVGASLSFDGDLEPDAIMNDQADLFCAAQSPYGAGDLGTPGRSNEICPPCPPGFEEVAEDVCEDIDECAEGNGGCDQNAACENQVGSAPICTCFDGFSGDGSFCEDIDECAEGNGGCDPYAICTNNIGADPTCECPEGFDGDGLLCEDINECLDFNGGCDQNATCTNNVGANPTCECNPFYEGSGITCTDINECDEENGGCDPDASCTNNVGAEPTCECNAFFIGNGRVCEEVLPNPVDYCNIQFPDVITVEQNQPLTFYMRYYELGITDQSPQTDVDPRVSVEMGIGARGTPLDDASWSWIDMVPNAGFDGNVAGQANNDEYLIDQVISTPGAYSFAFRISVDLEQTWVTCDRDGSGTNIGPAPDYGFELAQAGELDVTCPAGQQEVEGACVIPYSQAEATNLITSRCANCHNIYSWYIGFPNNAINNSNGRGYDYIEPGDYKTSYLWMKMTGAPGISGNQMPTTGRLTLEQTNRFAAWIKTLQ